ncbi:hypothetical protein [uncultured Campylobacter sp.]|uniref:hypothetical protein n=1 Tax=uncultured Campylobacter sp. TaxID=218934 RepID=UPI00260737DF|nr:hypothetical protein [uncultured Campylobacter sp.]
MSSLFVEFTSHSPAAALLYSASKFELRVKFISAAEFAAHSAAVSSCRARLSPFSTLVLPLVKFTAPSEFCAFEISVPEFRSLKLSLFKISPPQNGLSH